ncbi:hypothetical protein CL632_00930 [bacterium]|nr:hypothetical protein [bacterium]
MNFFRNTSNSIAVVALLGVVILGVASFFTASDIQENTSNISTNKGNIAANTGSINQAISLIADMDTVLSQVSNLANENQANLAALGVRVDTVEISASSASDSATTALEQLRKLRKNSATRAALEQVRRNSQRTLGLVLTGTVDSTGVRVWNQMTASNTSCTAEDTLTAAVASPKSVSSRIAALKKLVEETKKKADEANRKANDANSSAANAEQNTKDLRAELKSKAFK